MSNAKMITTSQAISVSNAVCTPIFTPDFSAFVHSRYTVLSRLL